MDMFLWMTPSPPWRAIAIAMVESVTVSMLALIIGIFNFRLGANSTLKSTSFGNTSLRAGTSKTSSNVYPSRTNFVSQPDILFPPLTSQQQLFLIKYHFRPLGASLKAHSF